MKRRTLHIVQKKGGGGGFTNEYRMYNRERARPLFVWNVDNGSQGAVWPSFFQLLENTETWGAADKMGTRGIPAYSSAFCLARQCGPLVSFPEFS